MTFKSCTRSYLFAGLVIVASIAPASTFADEADLENAVKIAQQLPDASGQARKWALRQPKETRVSYRGTVSFDSAGMQTGTMMYPAPNVAGLLAAILTHAAISESLKDSEKSRMQAEADKVLEPYRGILDALPYQRLMQDAIDTLETRLAVRLIHPTEDAMNDWVVEVTPVFFLTQDQSALILENTVVIVPPGASGKEKIQHRVRVVSFPIDETDPADYWLADEGARMKVQSASLLAQSLLIGLETPAASPTEADAFRTIRYREGKSEKVERAEMVREQCDRMVIRNLRGVLISIPVIQHSGPSEKATSCNS